jgi:phage portal protein BeeE
LTDEERDEMAIQFDLEDLLSADHAVKATSNSQYRAAGVITANEVRHTLNLAPIAGGDELSNPFTSSALAPAPAPQGEAE